MNKLYPILFGSLLSCAAFAQESEAPDPIITESTVTTKQETDLKSPPASAISPTIEVQEKLLEISEFELVIQINGKLRGKVLVDINLEQSEIEKIAKNVENVSSNLEGKDIKKSIYIKGKIINFVI